MQTTATNVDEYLQDIPDWQRHNLELFRNLVHEVEPNVIEVIKWGVPVFMHGTKMVFAMSAFKAHTKYNFIANGARLDDTTRLFNNGLESKQSRSIDIHETETVDPGALKDLIVQAIAKL